MPAHKFEYKRREPERTDLHRLVRTWFPSIPEMLRERFGPRAKLAKFQTAAVERYVACGQLASGFLRVRCTGCGDDRLVAFSCKVRGLCPSCDGKRMAEEAAHLVENVLPTAPYRQWVFTFPFWLRYVMAWDISLRDAIHTIVADCTRQFYLRRATLGGIKLAKCGGISVEHRFDSALKIDVHYHLLLADGVFVRTRARAGQPARVKFLPAAPLKPHDVPEVLAHVESRVMKLLKHRGMLQETADGQPPPDEFARKNPAMAAILQASLFDRSVLDPDRSVPPLRERGVKPDDVEWRKRNCTAHNQFTLHANSRIAPLDRKGLEKMICYLCRPALATDRVELLENDTIVRLRLKSAWRDGTTHLRMPAAEFVLRLLALIPAPRKKQFRYLGVFAANASWRQDVVRRPKQPNREKEREKTGCCSLGQHKPKPDDQQPGHHVSRLTWASAMQRAFKIDTLHCDRCGGRREVIAMIPSGEIATKILAHLKLPVAAEGFLPIRAPPWADDFEWAEADSGRTNGAPMPFQDALDAAA